MITDPLHPAVVHFPVVFATILPFIAILALIVIARGGDARRWWGVTVGALALLTVAAFVAVRTGGMEEDRVEGLVAEQPLESHEEAGERFVILSAVVLLVGAGGLLPRGAGRALRLVSTAGTFVLLAGIIQVGHSGAMLVYRHGAASAYVTAGAGQDLPTAAGREAGEGEARQESGD
jgi:uncharacterized membrane protein